MKVSASNFTEIWLEVKTAPKTHLLTKWISKETQIRNRTILKMGEIFPHNTKILPQKPKTKITSRQGSQPFLPPQKIKSNYGSASTGKVQVYNKVLNNIKKVYNIQKQVLYATELEKEKMNEDSKKKAVTMVHP